MQDNLISIKNLNILLPEGSDRKFAVKNINLDIKAGETVCVVGESGSGKSLTARAVMGLLPAPHVRVENGEIIFGKKDLVKIDYETIRQIRGSEISMIFQEPMTALNPVMSIGSQIDEIFRFHVSMSYKERRSKAIELLQNVNLPDPYQIVNSYPHELSGGQKQRVMIAMAILCEPKLIIADEPTSALDVTAQDTVLNVLIRLSKEKDIAILMITHDMGVVARFCERVNVMYGGYIVEQADVKTLFSKPAHPYTSALLAATPDLSQPRQVLQAIPGTQRTRIGVQPNGCPFLDRCPFSKTECKTPPVLVEIIKGHKTTCHFAGQLDLSV